MFDTLIETFPAKDGHSVEIHYDDHPESPREWCNLGTFWTFHSRYNSPDPDPDQEFKPNDREHIWLPVFMYDHSGVIYRAAHSNPFHCPWDSGCVGIIWVSKAQVRKEYGWKLITADRRVQILNYLKGEVDTYSQWAAGEVYGFVTKDPEGEEIDSCWGFFDDSTDFEYVRSEAEASI